jgi:hypothetical protein
MIVNVMEKHVVDAYERLKSSVKDFEETPRHREDVVVLALNRLPPKYVVSSAGKAVTEASLDTPQHRTAIEVQVFEALRQVARLPMNERPPSGS